MKRAVHDLGGRSGFGRVVVESAEPVFHAAWEGRVLGMVYVALGLGWVNLDAFRHGIERLEPARYLGSSYYERWLASLTTVLPEAGLLERGALRAEPTSPGFARELARAPRFELGDAVVARGSDSSGHTRLPGYARGKRGTIARAHGGFVLPDTNAHGRGEAPQYLYSVRFAARELWGERAEPRGSLHLDLFEPYLAPAEPA